MELAIIGAGPVGIYFSKLCLDKGFNVTLIEAGNYRAESILLNHEQYIFDTKSALPTGVHKIGGGSTKWRGRISEFLEEDFLTKKFSENSGWPINKGHLEMHYKELYKILGVGEISDRDLRDDLFSIESTALPENFYLRVFRYCEKNFFIKLFNEIKNHNQFTLLDNHFCQEIQSVNGSLTIKLALADGSLISKNFRKIVISCGALQSTALLQRSRKILPINSQNMVGRNLMEHLEGFIGTIVTKDKFEKNYFEKICNNNENRVTDKFQGIGVAISLKNQNSEFMDRLNTQYEIRLSTYDKSRMGEFSSSFKIIPRGISNMLGLLNFVTRVLILFKKKLKDLLDKVRRIKRFGVYIKAEEIRNFNSRIEVLKDYPNVLRYSHQVSDKTISLLKADIDEFKSTFNSHFASKLVCIKKLNNNTFFRNHFGPNWHPMGTTPFGSNELSAVCDKDLQIFGVKNLFVLSASVFPSGSNSNPTFTVLALANRLAHSKHFKKV